MVVFGKDALRQMAVAERELRQRRLASPQKETKGKGRRTRDGVETQVQIGQLGQLTQGGEEGEESRFGQMTISVVANGREKGGGMDGNAEREEEDG